MSWIHNVFYGSHFHGHAYIRDVICTTKNSTTMSCNPNSWLCLLTCIFTSKIYCNVFQPSYFLLMSHIRGNFLSTYFSPRVSASETSCWLNFFLGLKPSFSSHDTLSHGLWPYESDWKFLVVWILILWEKLHCFSLYSMLVTKESF